MPGLRRPRASSAAWRRRPVPARARPADLPREDEGRGGCGVKVNGLRADDLAGTGLVTRQRWAVPLWLGVLAAVTAFCWRRLARLAAALGRCWRGDVPAGL